MKKVIIGLMSFYMTNLFAQFSTTVPFLSINPNPAIKGLANIGVVSMDSVKFSGIISNPGLLRNNGQVNGMSCSIQDKSPNNISLIFSPLQNITFGYSYNYNSQSFAFFDRNNNFLGEFNDNDYYHSIRTGYTVNNKLNIGLGLKYFQSNLYKYSTQSIAFDLGMNYRNNLIKTNFAGFNYGFGLTLLNIGPKISYIKYAIKEFIPMDLNIGGIISASKNFDIFKLNLGLMYQADKLLVPTPPSYDTTGNIIVGRNPNRSVINALFTSFYDSPDGFKGELREINHHFGTELDIYIKNNFKFSIQLGQYIQTYFKDYGNYRTLGLGIETYGFNINYSRHFAKNNPITNNNEMYSLGYTLKI
jgi:hypothetical protein